MSHTVSSFPCRVLSLAEAATCLSQGGLVVYPTETFMGIGCNACDADAVARVYQVKQRSVQLPLPVIVSKVEAIKSIAHFHPAFFPLVQRFWPGPLTLLLPALGGVPTMLTGGTGRVAVRVSPHPVAQMLSAAVGGALVSSSANISGQPAARRAFEVDSRLLAGVDGIVLDGPEPAGSAPSTLVELLQDGPHPALRVLRLGAVSLEQLAEAGYDMLV